MTESFAVWYYERGFLRADGTFTDRRWAEQEAQTWPTESEAKAAQGSAERFEVVTIIESQYAARER